MIEIVKAPRRTYANIYIISFSLSFQGKRRQISRKLNKII